VNDRPEHARELAQLLLPLGGRVNLIPLSPVPEYPKPPSVRQTMDLFVRTLRNAGINATVRVSKGSDVNAACGQLRASHQHVSP
jgi:23S rRNA (adenine2503-C2)-methyltransferase